MAPVTWRRDSRTLTAVGSWRSGGALAAFAIAVSGTSAYDVLHGKPAFAGSA